MARPRKELPDEIRERIAFRAWNGSDHNFVRGTFSMAHAKAKAFRRVCPDRRVPGCDRRFQAWSPSADIKIAYNAEHGEPLYGWIAFTEMPTQTVVWFVYVKHPYRRMGLATHLVETFVHRKAVYPFDATHSVAFAQRLGIRFDPFVFEEQCFENQKSMHL